MGATSETMSWDVFVPYGGVHGVAVAICAALIATVALLGHELRGTPAERVLRRSLAIFGLAVWIFYNAWWNRHGIDLYGGLPLHFCDINSLIASLVLLTGNRWLRATLYFWATTLTLQAFIQPALAEGPSHVVFWTFWLSHMLIVACATYDIVVLGFRPGWSDLHRAALASIAYLVLITPVNLWFGANYGFVGDPPPERVLPPMLEALGAWPGRVVLMTGLTLIGFALALLPWRVSAGRQEPAHDELAPDDMPAERSAT